MDRSRYRGGTTAASKWGCAVAAGIGFPLFFVLLLADALGDCVPDTECGKGFFRFVLLPTVIVGLASFVTVRWIVDWFCRSDDRTG